MKDLYFDPPARLSAFVYTDETIPPPAPCATSGLPEPLKKARRLEFADPWANRRDVFLKQARLLENYEDDFVYNGDPTRYYPTYQSLLDDELRGYFAWRTKIRKGVFEPVSASFVFLYIYELINNVGVASPEEGYEKLLEIGRRYDDAEPKLRGYLAAWLKDYVVYYDLPKELLDAEPTGKFDRALGVLENIKGEKPEKVMAAIGDLAPKWLDRSRFYARNREDMDQIIFRVLKAMSQRYDKTCKRNLVEQFFGVLLPRHYFMFAQAVFCDPLKRKNYRYDIDERRYYLCKGGIWSEARRPGAAPSLQKLNKLLKTIDALARKAYGDSRSVKPEIGVKWITEIIRKEIAAHQVAQKEAARNRIDFASLDKIRVEAAITRDKLIVEEDVEPEEKTTAVKAAESGTPEPENRTLDSGETRFLRNLLYGGDQSWVKENGLFSSVLVDKINEKLYDVFGDAVLDDSPAPLEEYIDDLKEMFPA